MEDKDVVNGRHRQDSHPLFLPQHTASCAQSGPQEPAPSPGRVASRRTVLNVAEQGKEEKQTGAHIRPAHDARHRLRMNGMRSEHQAGHERPVSIPEKDLGEACEEPGDSRMQQDVDEMVAPGIQSSDGMVQSKGKSAERPVGLVAATVSQKSPPEIIVENVCPWGFWEQVLIRLDSTAEKQTNKKR